MSSPGGDHQCPGECTLELIINISVTTITLTCSIPNQGLVSAARSITSLHARLWLVSVGSLLYFDVSHIT